MGTGRDMTAMTDSQPQPAAAAPPTPSLHLVVGYDGSPPAGRARDAAVRLLQGRHRSIEVAYVEHIPGLDMMSAGVVAHMEADFDEIERDLRDSAAAELDARDVAWKFQRRHGSIAEELTAAASAIHDTHPDDTVVIMVGSSTQASHRILGSVAVNLARHCPMPLVIVP